MDSSPLDRHRRRRIYAWRACIIAAAGLTIVTFSPLVLSPDVIEPTLFGLPRTLWTGLLVAAGFLIATIVGAAIHPGRDDPNA